MPKNSIPAPSTIALSIPIPEPIQNILSGRRFFKHEATASPGYICPPVPPPVNAMEAIVQD
jgi:hypothetical protein